MNIALIGSGGREHAFAWKLKESILCEKLFIIPGNAGTASLGINVPLDPLDFINVGKFCLDNDVHMLVVGPEEPLVKGMRDLFEADDQLRNIAFVGPGSKGAILEGSKDFSKAFMLRHQIPTATYRTFTFETIHDGIDYIQSHATPVVLKADGLAAGKGVLICETREQAVAEFESMIREQKFGAASSRVVVESFLSGIELSVFVACDGNTYITLPTAKDYKRIGEGDTGLNTGGMGAISPVPFADSAFMDKVEERIIKPTIEGLKKEGISYKGFLFIGLMNVHGDPFVIEYNCRMGDPETEAVLPRIKSDFGSLMLAMAKGTLSEYILELDQKPTATVVLVSGGYPGAYEKGKEITIGKEESSSWVFHSGTRFSDTGNVMTNGGRVFAITSSGDSIRDAVTASMQVARAIQFEGKYYRSDIGYEFI